MTTLVEILNSLTDFCKFSIAMYILTSFAVLENAYFPNHMYRP